LFSALIERLHEIAADKTGRAGDDEGHGRPAVMGFVVRAARTASGARAVMQP
jgi:hypothetical protein